jgi:hypothetical protein
MILDKQTLLSDAQALTSDGASTNLYDTGSASDPGAGAPLKVFMSIDEAFTNLTSLDISLQCHEDTGFSAGTKTLWKVNALLADLTLGAKIDLPDVPAGCERYLRLYYDVNGSDPGAGKITAGIILDDQKNTPTAD